MKKIEMITRSNGIKKKNTFKIKTAKDTAKLMALLQFCMVKDDIVKDVDLTGSVSFKVDGEKMPISKIYSDLSTKYKKQKSKDMVDSMKDNDMSLEKDKDGRIIIHSRKTTAAIDSKTKKKDKKAKLKKKLNSVHNKKSKKKGKKRR